MLPQWLEAPPTMLESVLPAARMKPLAADVAKLCAHIDTFAQRTAGAEGLDPPMDAEVLHSLFSKGLFSLTVPAEDGGMNASMRDFVVAMEHVGQLGPAYAMTVVPHLCISVKSVASLCPPDMRHAVLQGIRQHEKLIAFAITEDHGSDVAAMKTHLTRAADGRMLLNGRKQWITNLARASHVVVVALCPDLHPAPGAAVLVLVPTDQAGVGASAPWDKACANGSDTADLFLDSVEIAEHQLLGAPGCGMALFHQMVQPGRLGATAAALGMARAALRAAENDPRQAISSAEAEEMHTRLDVLGSAVRLCATLGDVGHAEFACMTALVKHRCSSLAHTVVGRIDHAYARCGHVSPAMVERAHQSIGLFRLLKGPGEVISHQTIMAWSARIRQEFSAPATWPRSIQLSARVVTRAFVELRLRGGPAVHPVAAMSLADLCARAWLLMSAQYLAHDGARLTTPAERRRCRLWAWRHFCELAREHGHSLASPSAAVIHDLYPALRDAARMGALSRARLREPVWE